MIPEFHRVLRNLINKCNHTLFKRNSITDYTTAPLATRDINWGGLPKTVTRMDAGVEPPGRVLRRAL